VIGWLFLAAAYVFIFIREALRMAGTSGAASEEVLSDGLGDAPGREEDE